MRHFYLLVVAFCLTTLMFYARGLGRAAERDLTYDVEWVNPASPNYAAESVARVRRAAVVDGLLSSLATLAGAAAGFLARHNLSHYSSRSPSKLRVRDRNESD
jgi:hypothetical protein